MMTIGKVSKISGISIRTLRYYDKIGLLSPVLITEKGYRMYDGNSLERLEQILILKELDFPLNTIKNILNSPDNKNVIENQIKILKLKKERIDRIISLAEKLCKGESSMDFKPFDKTEIKKYEKSAREKWGNTEAFKEYDKKTENYSIEAFNSASGGLMRIFGEIGNKMNLPPESEEIKALIKKLQSFITENFYTCTDTILLSLGEMYVSDIKMAENIDRAGGKGTAKFTNDAIKIYCKTKQSDCAY